LVKESGKDSKQYSWIGSGETERGASGREKNSTRLDRKKRRTRRKPSLISEKATTAGVFWSLNQEVKGDFKAQGSRRGDKNQRFKGKKHLTSERVRIHLKESAPENEKGLGGNGEPMTKPGGFRVKKSSGVKGPLGEKGGAEEGSWGRLRGARDNNGLQSLTSRA